MTERGQPLPGAWLCDEGTWLDPEDARARRAKVICPDGRLRIIRVSGSPDTAFSVPMIGKLDGHRAYIHAENRVLYLRFETKEES